ncbi:voltage-gated chloride channel protein [Pelistega sp. NLN82]|uniref:Voltage-gated chloride channel protein n=1 Tax=Pelistega ratti TaxID=2652177 RepID=A0A6L9Y4U5_9BURK|nr:chloride channel protein [Pelistega ratti]NEN75266.1 voltage-gated chloride channel protein [Pelistega ratti]
MSSRITILLAILATGILAGLGAVALTWLIHGIEYLAFGQSEATKRIITAGTSPERRIIAMFIGSIIVALGWYYLSYKERNIIHIHTIVEGTHQQPPAFFPSVLHTVLQIIAVGCGAPIGREAAPRELGALFAERISHYLHIDAVTRKTIIASGAAAGLAAVYQVPFAGVLFTLEILLGVFSITNACIAIAISVLAVFVAQIGVNAETFYLVTQIEGDIYTTLIAAVVGAIIGIPATYFSLAIQQAEKQRIKGKKILWTLPLAFLITGILAIYFPQILGNGRSAAQIAFWGSSLWLCIGLLISKALVVWLTLKSGAYGGTLTPSVALGALSGLLIGLLLQTYYPSIDLTAMSLAGAVAFLAVSMHAPLTAFALIIGFTGQEFDAYLPLLAAVTCAMGTSSFINYSKPLSDKP